MVYEAYFAQDWPTFAYGNSRLVYLTVLRSSLNPEGPTQEFI